MAHSLLDLDNTNYYNNRELSWLDFNERVLEEALDSANPLGERLKFLAIVSSNLDEFFMVRVAGLKDQVKAGYNRPENKAGLTPKQQLAAISAKNHRLVAKQYCIFNKQMLPLLQKEKIAFAQINALNEGQYQFVESLFEEQIFPVLTPLAIDAYRPFPILLNKSLNLAVVIADEQDNQTDNQKFALVQVPSVLERFIEIPTTADEKQYVLLEDVITYFIDRLFQGFAVVSVSPFRITRNADLTLQEEGAHDLLKEIEKELKKRKRGAAVRLEIEKGKMDDAILRFLLSALEIYKDDVYEIDGPLDLTFLFRFKSSICEWKEHLMYEALIPLPVIDFIGEEENIFNIISEKDVFVHHPYESFQSVIDFLDQASEDPYVLAIKQTLYRVSGNSPVINALKRAAENGKQVTVLVELKARFDEENNVQWAKELERAGCHVIYGMTYLKTHCKITLVVRKKGHKIQRFLHLGTGNYNDVTAETYTDMGLFTSNQKFGEDATHFFNYLSGYTEKPYFHYFSVSPFDIRDDLIRYIDNEIAFQKKYGNGRIIAKMNAMTDKKLIKKLYEASSAGVQIDLIIRGICCLRPGIPKVSENIRVRSIVGRFLEHSRIYYFHHNGEEKIFLSSADLMTRNMERRVEILFPIFSCSIKQKIISALDIQLADNRKAREQMSDGAYRYVEKKEGEEAINSQQKQYEMLLREREALQI